MAEPEFDEFAAHISAAREAAGDPPLDDGELRARFGPFCASAADYAEYVLERAESAAAAARSKAGKFRQLAENAEIDAAAASAAVEQARAGRDRWAELAGGSTAPPGGPHTRAAAGTAVGEG